MSEENENEVVETAGDATEEAPEQKTLALNDIVLAANIIDLVTQRGAFKASEAGHVGACFNKLVGFVKATQKAKPSRGRTRRYYRRGSRGVSR